MFETKTQIEFIKKYITHIVVAIILALALVIYLLSQFMTGDSGAVIVMVDGRETGVYSLYEDREIRIETQEGYNLLVIGEGQAYVSEADCSNQVCVHTQPVSESGGQIICLPHQVVIRLKTTEERDVDAVTN